MSIRLNHALLLGSTTFLSLSSISEVLAQVEIPPVVVQAPSPIRRPPARPAQPKQAARPAALAPAAPAAPAAPTAPAQGTLPVVTDQFATVTVVPNEEIRRNGSSTLGDLLFSKPGVTGSSFAPGASSRPIIRGLDVNRVSIVENGVGANGASDLGEDHFVPVDPLSTNQVEVIRGPATLRYGSTAIGGVVYSENNRIPDALPCRPTDAAQRSVVVKAPPATTSNDAGCWSAEARSSFSSVDNGINGGLLLDAGKGPWVFHADVFGRQADDYRVPSYPYLVPPNPADAPRATQPGQFNGKQPNSALHTNGWSMGGSYLFDGGFAGVAVMQNNALYHIPGIDGENTNTRIDANQTKVLSKAEWHPPSEAIDVIRFWGGVTDYKHNELGLADPLDPASDGVRQTFTNKEQEGRLEVTLKPFNLRFAELTTALGVQAGHQELTAPSPDDPGSPLNGLWNPNNNRRVAGFMFNEFKFSETTKAQVAGRIENVHLNGSTPDFPSLIFDSSVPGSIGPTVGHSVDFTPKSASVGLIQNLSWNLVGSITAQHVERAPKPAELFSRGAHDATATFDIGDPNLKIESANSIEAGIRRATGPFRFELTAYYTHFNGFIFRRLTGNTCDESSCILGPGDELKQAVYSQRDANFRGVEWQSQYEVAPLWMGAWGIENQFDVVRATLSDGTNVPRIPPVRIGGGLFYRDSAWLARVNLLHAFPQNNIALVGETPTPGYNDLRAELSYRWTPVRLTPDSVREVLVGITGTNLLNDDMRNSVSYTKDEVLMPGRGVRLFANVKY